MFYKISNVKISATEFDLVINKVRDSSRSCTQIASGGLVEIV